MFKYFPIALLFLLGCSSSGKNGDAGADGDTDTDTDTDSDDECTGDDTFDPEDCPDVSDITDCVVYVDADAPDGGDGRSWATAVADLQDGLDLATCGVLTTDYCQSWQVWAAEGSYYAWRTCEELDTFWIRSGVHLYGGFAGDESSPTERDIEAHPTVLDGRDGPEGENRVYNIALIHGEDIRLDGVTLTGASAHGEDYFQGGGLAVFYASAIVVEGCTFEDNSAYQGGGIYAHTAELELIDCVFRANDAKIGGGVYMISTIAAVDGCTFEENAAVYNDEGWGGGLFLGSGTAAQITDSQFLDNTAAESSAAISIWEANVSIDGCTLSGNEAPNAGALGAGNGEVTIDAVAFDANQAVGDEGTGGAAVLVGGQVDIADSTFTNNASTFGGGLFADDCQLDIVSTEFEGNSASIWGAAMFAQDGTAIVTGSTFADNACEAGAVSFVQNQDVDVSGCLFVGNSAIEPGAALGTVMNEELTVSHCTFAGNGTDSGGSAIYAMDELLVLNDSILWDETTPEISLTSDETPAPIVTYSDVRGGWEGEGNIDADPLFVDPDGGDYCLQEGSPCIGTASDAGAMGYCPYEGK